MNRRSMLRRAAAISLLPGLWPRRAGPQIAAGVPVRRTRPSDPSWPSATSWDELNRAVGGNLIRLQSSLADCAVAADSSSCRDLLENLRNPYYLGDQPGLTQTSGWVDAWTSTPGAYAVAARATADVVAAVDFAREHNLRLVVKGGGHSYQGTSNAADSLLIWTRAMNRMVLHDAFVGQGCEGVGAPQPAVTVEAGAMWMHVYDAVTTKAVTSKAADAPPSGSPALSRAAGLAASRKTTALPQRGSSKPKSSPPTVP